MGFAPVREPGAGHALAQAALFEENFLQTAELLVDQVVGLMNQADGNVGDNFRRAGFDELAVNVGKAEGEVVDDLGFLERV